MANRSPMSRTSARVMPQLPEQSRRRTRQTDVHQKSHGRGSRGQRMMLLLLHQFAREFQRRADVLDGQLVFPLNVFETHAAGQAAHHDGHRRACAANHRFSMADSRVNDDSIAHAGRENTRYRQGAQASETRASVPSVASCSNRRRCPRCYEGSSLNGLKTFNPGRRKCLSLPVTMVRSHG